MALVLMCGLSFSGKSTLASGIAQKLHAHLLSLDRINEERGLDGGQGIPLEDWANTNQIAHHRARSILASGKHVVVDDTSSPRFIRDAWRSTATAADASFVLVWVQITPELQLSRVEANRRDRKRNDVVDGVLRDHAEQFEAPDNEGALIISAENTGSADHLERLVSEIRAVGPR